MPFKCRRAGVAALAIQSGLARASVVKDRTHAPKALPDGAQACPNANRTFETLRRGLGARDAVLQGVLGSRGPIDALAQGPKARRSEQTRTVLSPQFCRLRAGATIPIRPKTTPKFIAKIA
jgi:hypothetical protein